MPPPAGRLPVKFEASDKTVTRTAPVTAAPGRVLLVIRPEPEKSDLPVRDH
jgi:hypothetical protein